jgi:hypothetical protein
MSPHSDVAAFYMSYGVCVTPQSVEIAKLKSEVTALSAAKPS